MSDREQEKKPLSLNRSKLELSKTIEAGQVRQNFSHGRSKSVTVEVRKKRTFEKNESGRFREVKKDLVEEQAPAAEKPAPEAKKEPVEEPKSRQTVDDHGNLTDSERAARMAALKAAEERRKQEEADAEIRAREEAARKAEEEARKAEEAKAAAEAKQEEEKPAASENDSPSVEEVEKQLAASTAKGKTSKPKPAGKPKAEENVMQGEPAEPLVPEERRRAAPADAKSKSRKEIDEENARQAARKRAEEEAGRAARGKGDDGRRRGKLSINNAMSGDEGGRRRSMASIKRQQAKAKARAQGPQKPKEKVVRDVVIPDVITVQELANRMAERAADVIKTLMSMGVMATINQSLDPDTAQLVVEEFGHNMRRVSDADVEEALVAADDNEEQLIGRPPVVTVMGHVDHGKTSLLDALRATDVAGGEAGGITQHIGAYQVTMATGSKITFIDTPGHAAFTEMRSRGAKVTDIVVLVVAADDSVMPQTIEAISHAKAADVPMIVAINKIDKPGANPSKVKTELLQHEVVVEEMGGDVQAVEVSAKQRTGLTELEEAILLQSEVLDLKANPERVADGVVVEARMEKGRGPVATVLVQRGTLRTGDIFVTGPEWGRVRALIDDHGNRVAEAIPGMPVEVTGLNGVPSAGDDFVVVENEAKAREVSDFRQRRIRETQAAAMKKSALENMFSQSGDVKELPIVIKGDVQGSVEALIGTLQKLGNEEVSVRVLHSGVGGINESDVTLARASNALIIGFNVRANQQAREQSRRDNVDIRYYSIIYDVADDIKKMLSGMLSPEVREKFLGYAEIRDIFTISGNKIAGCMVTEGIVKRGAGVRLLRDNVVIHSGELSTLRRFKDEVKEVREGYECGMSFAKYNDIQAGDVIECFENEEIAVEL
ncbi:MULTISPECIES: translation initiation factor IF-2 [Thalassospira]|jgi:translation initiation factor IF-2|uniref:Translation initiation factor IF-2 n=1 Tax=Thalassospira profundimaris TaxID=502049 RepID=A0A367VIK9_9PROT|nr:MULTISPECIES: translation initiation factor IF-2 [Thalassospira]KZB71588.1 translation initiation factor IF-2 [Thalassospira sp. MCCC 1A01148]MBC45642.1 translation initiation factor IF-2 [Thalassospira sp.]MBO6806667.1 translation initiation factor IF-2 [Thalassospira sp.]MBO6840290.1 translation initiation factor IF-2 [Thalassospira sp.]MBS8275833.1 translation initiation factor IF-2 [Thalassospira tepidiphila]|tara:strand:+ start:191 stop:2860 length:2670 start_codon:yes stop_codon:yes gene_type:complete